MSDSASDSAKHRAWLLFFLAIFGLYQIGLAFHVLQNSGIYGEIAIPPIIQLGLAIFWLSLFLGAAWQVVRKKPSALRYTLWVLLSFIGWRLLQSLLFAQADYDRNRSPFLLLVIILILGIPLLRWYWRVQSGSENERG